MLTHIITCDALGNLVTLLYFKKREKRPWRNVVFLKSKTPPWVFFPIFKLYKWYQIVQSFSHNKSMYKAASLCDKPRLFSVT